MRRKSYATVNFRLDPELHKKLRDKTPNHGDMTNVLTKLVSLYVNGKIKFNESVSIDNSIELGGAQMN